VYVNVEKAVERKREKNAARARKRRAKRNERIEVLKKEVRAKLNCKLDHSHNK
jgi:hypothetical protein